MSQLSTIIISHGCYKNTTSLANNDEIVPDNIRLFYYNFDEIDYDNYYLLQIYKQTPKILFFINKNTGKIFKKEFIHKEYSPNEKIPKEIVLSFNNIKHMMNISSLIIHPNGYKQDFHNNGKRDSVIITLFELLTQLSQSYNKLFPNEIVEIHLTSHTNGNWENSKINTIKQMILYDNVNKFTIEETQNMESMLLQDFIIVNKYPKAKFIGDLAHKKTSVNNIIKKTRTFFSKYRKNDSHLKTYKNYS